MKELGRSCEDATDMLGIGCHLQVSSSLHGASWSDCGSHEDQLNLSPWSLHHRDCPATELVKEIAALEFEVSYLERYLLSLYRAAFDQYLDTSQVKEQASKSPSIYQPGSPLRDSSILEKYEYKSMDSYQPFACLSSCNYRVDQSCCLGDIKKNNDFRSQESRIYPGNYSADSEDGSILPSRKLSSDSSRPTSHHHSLADHFGSLADYAYETPSKLSEEIVRCISSIYNKLAEHPLSQIYFLASPVSSPSSASTFSPKNTYDAWSPRYHFDSTTSPCHLDVLKDKRSPHSRMLEVRKICIDGGRFDYAAKMLQNFRDLIHCLERVDPTKMEHEEKLAFWINLHNALVMHANLAYGLRQNDMKSTSSIMKAQYNVGGLSINAYEIQSSIFGCQPHRPELRLQRLFSRSQRFKKGSRKHAYAIDQLEPLVHFALCMGSYSDPAVRVYTAKNVLKELELSKDEFVQSNVSIHRGTKIILPKILQYYARDAAMDLSAILEMVHDCIPETQQQAIRSCLKERAEKCVEWSPYKSRFRYIIHGNLAKE